MVPGNRPHERNRSSDETLAAMEPMGGAVRMGGGRRKSTRSSQRPPAIPARWKCCERLPRTSLSWQNIVSGH